MADPVLLSLLHSYALVISAAFLFALLVPLHHRPIYSNVFPYLIQYSLVPKKLNVGLLPLMHVRVRITLRMNTLYDFAKRVIKFPPAIGLPVLDVTTLIAKYYARK